MKDTEFERLSEQLTNRQPNFEWSETVDNTKECIRMEMFKDAYVAAVSRGEDAGICNAFALHGIMYFDEFFKEPSEEE